jgi:hypothetical protein
MERVSSRKGRRGVAGNVSLQFFSKAQKFLEALEIERASLRKEEVQQTANRFIPAQRLRSFFETLKMDRAILRTFEVIKSCSITKTKISLIRTQKFCYIAKQSGI